MTMGTRFTNAGQAADTALRGHGTALPGPDRALRAGYKIGYPFCLFCLNFFVLIPFIYLNQNISNPPSSDRILPFTL